MTAARFDTALWRWGCVLLSVALPLLLMHAFLPMDEFVHRGDDAFYYFKIAVNYPRVGFWSFDGVHATNGVQPLWALMLTALAFPLHWLGASDAVAARVFVALTALFHFVSCMLLYRLIARTVSVGTGLAAAGGLLFSMGIVWSHVWGMENSLYATLLLGAISYYHFRFRPDPGVRTALVLGLLLGLTSLSRLNSGLLVPWLLLAYVAAGPRSALPSRVRLAVFVCLGVAAFVGPYVAWNAATTGHLLPISGAVKQVQAAQWLAERDVESRLSREFASAVYWRWRAPVQWFLASRALDGLWIVGARIPFKDSITSVTNLVWTFRVVLAILAALAVGPLLFRARRDWMRLLRKRARRVGRFWYVAAFAGMNATLSVVMYPSEVYSVIRWWLAESEFLVVVATATLVTAWLAHVGRRLPPPRRLAFAVVPVAVLALWHGAESIRFYWDGEKQTYDWNQSWNDQMLRAARWMNANLPADAVVGSWNAGVLGYYSTRTVVNLDGLINNFDLLPFLRQRDVATYVRREGIRYLSDYQPELDLEGLLTVLPTEPVYTSWTPWGEPYRVYRILD